MVKINLRGGLSRLWLITFLFTCLSLEGAAHAVTPLSQGYVTSDTMPLGSIVSLDSDTADTVSATSLKNTNSILGVVISNDSSLISLNSGKSHQIQIATSGVVQVLVSDINGDIKSGDAITASPISGIGMKATVNSKIVGVAQDNLSKTSGNTTSYTDKSGKKHSLVLGEVPAMVNVSYFYKQPDKTLIPQALQNVADALSGKKVSAAPIIISMAVFIITLIVVVSIIYSMIHSSIISVGRNPMSQAAIYRDLIQLSTLVIGILGVAMIAIYMILTRL